MLRNEISKSPASKRCAGYQLDNPFIGLFEFYSLPSPLLSPLPFHSPCGKIEFFPPGLSEESHVQCCLKLPVTAARLIGQIVAFSRGSAFLRC